jgi:acetoin utilization deacetylase AcuC-like enzyme
MPFTPPRPRSNIALKIYYTDHFVLPLPDGHRFPMTKYRRLRDRIVQSPVHNNDRLLVPPAASIDQLCLAHEPEYVERVLRGTLSPTEIKRIGFPWSPEMVERSRRSSGATIAAARAALDEGIAVNLAGGTHHALSDAGEGFCVFNDAAVTLLALHQEGLIRNGLVVDCDVHQGNGTAQILRPHPHFFTFSMHGAKNFPLRKFPSSWDIDLPDGTTDAAYLAILEGAMKSIMEKSSFDLAIYLAGADPYEGDRLGRLKLTKTGLIQRDRMVIGTLLTAGIPVAIAMAGGYANAIDDIVDIHAATVEIASLAYRNIAERRTQL